MSMRTDTLRSKGRRLIVNAPGLGHSPQRSDQTYPGCRHRLVERIQVEVKHHDLVMPELEAETSPVVRQPGMGCVALVFPGRARFHGEDGGEIAPPAQASLQASGSRNEIVSQFP